MIISIPVIFIIPPCISLLIQVRIIDHKSNWKRDYYTQQHRHVQHVLNQHRHPLLLVDVSALLLVDVSPLLQNLLLWPLPPLSKLSDQLVWKPRFPILSFAVPVGRLELLVVSFIPVTGVDELVIILSHLCRLLGTLCYARRRRLSLAHPTQEIHPPR